MDLTEKLKTVGRQAVTQSSPPLLNDMQMGEVYKHSPPEQLSGNLPKRPNPIFGTRL